VPPPLVEYGETPSRVTLTTSAGTYGAGSETVQVIGVPELPRLRVVGETLTETSNPRASDAKNITQPKNALTNGDLTRVAIIFSS
jgi:hypothetical protein